MNAIYNFYSQPVTDEIIEEIKEYTEKNCLSINKERYEKMIKETSKERIVDDTGVISLVRLTLYKEKIGVYYVELCHDL